MVIGINKAIDISSIGLRQSRRARKIEQKYDLEYLNQERQTIKQNAIEEAKYKITI